jgi:hypothetical protein
MTFRFRYADVRDCGIGIMMTSCELAPNVTQKEAEEIQKECEKNGVTAGVWQDRRHGLRLQFYSGEEREDILLSEPTNSWNEMEIVYSQAQYTLYVNGNGVFTSMESPHRPTLIWMGHPAELDIPCWWDSLQIDFVKVESLP